MLTDKFCKCVSHGCNLKTYVNEFGSTCSGSFVNRKEYSTHSKDDKALKLHDRAACSIKSSGTRNEGIDGAHVGSTPSNSTDILPNAQDVPGLITQGAEPDSAHIESTSSESISMGLVIGNGVSRDFYLRTSCAFDAIKVELENWSIAFLSVQELVFIETSQVTVASCQISAGRQSRSPNSGTLR